MNKRNKNTSKKGKYSLKTVIVTAVITSLIMVGISNINDIGKYIVAKISEPKFELEYEIMANHTLTKAELSQIINANFNKRKVDFSMDDDFISSYHLTVVELRNLGPFINDELFIDADFRDERVKILDVLCKVLKPKERELEIETERPPLKYQMPGEEVDSHTVELGIDCDPMQLGIIIYRSYLPYGGYGRRNPEIVSDLHYEDKVSVGRHFWYTVSHLGFSGLESQLVEPPLQYPECSFNLPSFSECKKIKIKDPIEEINIKDFVEELNACKKQNQKVYVDLNRKDFQRLGMPQVIANIPVYFRDDVQFLRGKTTLFFKNIPKKSKMRLYLVSKSYISNYGDKLEFTLREFKDIELSKKIKEDARESIRSELESYELLMRHAKVKAELTPFQTRIFSGTNEVILAWTLPKAKNYEFVRIFRTDFSALKFETDWGKEIYEGKGTRGLIIGKSDAAKNFRISEIKLLPSAPIPPPRSVQEEPKRPAPPSGFRITGYKLEPLNIRDGEIMSFFKDKDVEDGKAYIYTLVAYNDEKHCSYPIESVIKSGGDDSELEINSFEKYEEDPELLKILHQYYKDRGYELKAERLEPATTNNP